MSSAASKLISAVYYFLINPNGIFCYRGQETNKNMKIYFSAQEN
jgi:filamentous hemagglutinin family protein